jgi:hypothetical protein
MFTITHSKGFQMTFANGNTVSVQFGQGNYCENRNAPDENQKFHRCQNAEFWVWDKNNNPLIDNPLGWQTPDEIAALIAKYSA